MSDKWITTNKAAEISDYHPDHIRRLVRKGRIRAKKFGPIWQVSKESLEKYILHQENLGIKRGPKTDL